MQFQLTQLEEKERKAFAELCDGEFKTRSQHIDQQAEIPQSYFASLSETGYLGFALDKNCGGQGKSLVQWAVLAEHLARTCPSTFASVCVSSHLFGYLVSRLGTDEQKEKYLPGISAGKIKGAVAVTNTKHQTDIGPGRMLLEIANGSFVLSGSKPYVINGPDCNVVLVSTSEDHKKQRLFIVDASSDGVTWGQRLGTLGIRGTSVCPLELWRCPVLPEDEINNEKAMDLLSQLQNLWWAVYGVGVSQACLDEAMAYALHRKIDGKPLVKHQEVHFKIAEMHLETDTARLLAYKAAWLIEKDLPDDGVCQAAKVLATETASRNAHKAVQIHGGKGYLQGQAVERLYRDSRLGELIGTPSENLRMSVALQVFESIR